MSIGALNAQEQSTTTTTKTTTTYGSGTVTEYVPGTTFIVKETTGPVTYRYGDKVVYETKAGQVITDADLATRVKVGAPVRVYYNMDGDARVVSRVIVDD